MESYRLARETRDELMWDRTIAVASAKVCRICPTLIGLLGPDET
jgi:hypothetical protein